MPQNSFTRTATTLVASTMENFAPEMAEQIFRSIPALWVYMERAPESIKFVNGGREFVTSILVAKNPNAKSWRGYDRINVNPSEEFTQIREFWSGLACGVAMSFDDALQNNGEEAMFDMVEEKMSVAQMTLRDLLAKQLVRGVVGGTVEDPYQVTNGNRSFVPGNFGKDVLPLTYIIQKNFTTAYTLHGVAQATAGNEYWQNQRKLSSFSAAGGIAMLIEMENLYNNCSKGSTLDFTKCILADQNYFEYYCNGRLALQRFPAYDDAEAVSAGFKAVKFKQASIFLDDNVPSYGTTADDTVSLTSSATAAVSLWLNTNWLRLNIHPLANFTPTDFVEPEDQLAMYAKIFWMGQQTCRQRRKLGVHYNVNTTIALT